MTDFLCFTTSRSAVDGRTQEDVQEKEGEEEEEEEEEETEVEDICVSSDEQELNPNKTNNGENIDAVNNSPSENDHQPELH